MPDRLSSRWLNLNAVSKKGKQKKKDKRAKKYQDENKHKRNNYRLRAVRDSYLKKVKREHDLLRNPVIGSLVFFHITRRYMALYRGSKIKLSPEQVLMLMLANHLKDYRNVTMQAFLKDVGCRNTAYHSGKLIEYGFVGYTRVQGKSTWHFITPQGQRIANLLTKDLLKPVTKLAFDRSPKAMRLKNLKR